jgi:predicted dienelactone hydrolase
MKRAKNLAVLTIVMILFACSPKPALVPTVTPTNIIIPTQEFELLPLANPGPYHMGRRQYTFYDTARANRRVDITIWYPALVSADTATSVPVDDAEPDLNDAPYPLILSSTKMARILAPYMISHGFTWASVDRIDVYAEMNEEMIDQPLDILFALDQAGSGSLQGLDGVIDAEHTGVIGYSFDGYNTLALSGARIDPQYYLSLCAGSGSKSQPLSAFSCKPAEKWDEFSSHAGEAITNSEDGLWQPMTDERIRAVMPMAGEGFWLFGEKGLAAVDRPVLMIVATRDELYPENKQIFNSLGTQDKGLISFIGLTHMMIYDPEQIARMAHFAVAFFGYHLQGKEDLAYYFSEDFVDRSIDMHWGVYYGVHVPKN